MVNFFYDAQKQAEARLYEFLRFMDLLNCKRCWRRRYKGETAKWGRPWHHHGGFLHLLSQSHGINKADLHCWVKDTEHGFAHGLMTAFWAFLLEDQNALMRESTIGFFKDREKAENYLCREMRPEKLIVACLFHDYLKCKGQCEGHDAKLRDFFPYLDERVFEHASPPDESYSMIQGDRIELLRFPDAAEWVDMSRLKNFDFAPHFYKHIRPIIDRVIRFREDVWLSHVVESKEGDKRFYPSAHWLAKEAGLDEFYDPSSDCFSVHCGRLPFKECLDHTEELGGVIGLISKEMLGGRKIIAAPLSSWGRDHPFIETRGAQIPVEDWIFLYRKTEHLEWLDLSRVHPISISLFNRLVTTIDDVLVRVFALMI